MVFQKEDEQGERMECLVEVKVEWLDSVGREGRGDRGKKGRSQLHIGFVLFPGCCCAEAHISQAIMIDSFAISLGAVHGGTVCCSHTCQRVHSLANVVRFAADPDVHGWPETAAWEPGKEERKRKC